MVLKLNELILNVVEKKMYIRAPVYTFHYMYALSHRQLNIYFLNPKLNSIIINSGIFHNTSRFDICF